LQAKAAKWDIIRMLLAKQPMELLQDPKLNSNSSRLPKTHRSYTSAMLSLLKQYSGQKDITSVDRQSRATSRTHSGLKQRAYLKKR
jgi:hypothetical protein